MSDGAFSPQPAHQGQGERPRLLIFYSDTSGLCRRVDAYLAQILQRHHNHDAFDIVRLRVADRPKAVEFFGIDALPTLIVVRDGAVQMRLDAPRRRIEMEKALEPWLRRAVRPAAKPRASGHAQQAAG
jgi:thioredoxin-like negative regulator of GroEL